MNIRMSDSKLKLYWLASRPKTLPAAAAPVLIGTGLAIGAESFHFLSALAALFGALFIQIGTNLANDYFDFKKGSDREDRLGPTRVTQAGLISPQTVKLATMVAFGIAFLLGIYLVYRGGIPIVIIGLCSILFGVLYTGGPYPIGYIGLGEVFVFIFFGPIAVAGTYYVQALSLPNSVIIAGIAPGLFSSAILIVNNLRDINADKISGKKTLAVRFGERFSKIQYTVCIILSTLVPIYFYFQSHNMYILLPTIILIPSLMAVKKIQTESGTALNNLLAFTGKLLFFYAILFAVGAVL